MPAAERFDPRRDAIPVGLVEHRARQGRRPSGDPTPSDHMRTHPPRSAFARRRAIVRAFDGLERSRRENTNDSGSDAGLRPPASSAAQPAGKGKKVARDYANTIATLQTDMGDIQIKFFYDKAPKHVENFVDLAAKGFYDGTIFHRVIPAS